MSELEPGTVPLSRAELLERIGQLWRGDWSGHVFDGKDGQDWINRALYGNGEDLDALARELDRVEREYE